MKVISNNRITFLAKSKIVFKILVCWFLSLLWLSPIFLNDCSCSDWNLCVFDWFLIFYLLGILIFFYYNLDRLSLWFGNLLLKHTYFSFVFCAIFFFNWSFFNWSYFVLLRSHLLMRLYSTLVCDTTQGFNILLQIILIKFTNWIERYVSLWTFLSSAFSTLTYSFWAFLLFLFRPFWNLSREVVKSMSIFIHIIMIEFLKLLWFLKFLLSLLFSVFI